ncbi:MAG: 16S rRNA (cytidine(1402)-2'-O)-methyltransferase [Candidatus Omnitrophica bacterium]|nr:16S rRNA (cytidine(1402)-2'-O)-methyltransferase [Candidatus Omnitrophota bacterium]
MVSTPIGNLEDVTLRAVRILKEVDLIAAEDTRKTRILLSSQGISTPLTSYHSYNLKTKTPQLVKKLLEGERIALVSDSGTPGISDPGSVLVASCIENKVPLVAIPGPTAFVAALVLSGKPTHKFVFEGFLSNKKGRRQKQLKSLKDEERTVILYESPHRIVKFLKDFVEVVGDRDIVIAREITKKFEEMRREKASKQLEHFSEHKPRGEFIVIF